MDQGCDKRNHGNYKYECLYIICERVHNSYISFFLISMWVERIMIFRVLDLIPIRVILACLDYFPHYHSTLKPIM